MNIIDRWHLRAVTNIFKEKGGKPFPRNDDLFTVSSVTDEQKLEGYSSLPLIKAVVNLVALITHGQGFTVKSDTLQDNNDALLKTTTNDFTMADRQISLTAIVDILVEFDSSKGTTVLKPIPLSHVMARPDHINDSYVLEWESESSVVDKTNGEITEQQNTIKQVYNKKEIITYIDGKIIPEYSYPNTIGIQRIVTINIQELPGRNDPMIGVLEYNISTLYKQALNALGAVVKITGEPDKFATGAYKVPKDGIEVVKDSEGNGSTISIPQFMFEDANAKYGWTEPPKGIPEIIKFLEVLFWLFLEQTGTPEGTLSTVTGMNSTANQLQVFIRTIVARQGAQTEGLKEIMAALEAVNNLNSIDKVDLSGDIEWPEAFPDTATIKEIVIALMQDTGLSTETKLETIRNKYIDDLPEWEVESKRIDGQRTAEFKSELNAHHEDGDEIE